MKLAVVVPRYGERVVGGAESLARGLAQAGLKRGWQVEIWTTCADDHFTFRNTLPAGRANVHGVDVVRFPITSFDREQAARLEGKIVGSGGLPVEEQYDWLDAAAHSAGLYAHVAGHAAEFDAVITLPYASPLIHYACWAAPDRTILWPCLHNEPYAYFEPLRLLMESVYGVMYNSPEEGHLASRQLLIHPKRQAVLGAGVTVREGSEVRPNGSEEYLLYFGRLEAGKNLALLYDYMQRYVEEEGRLRLQVWGAGPLRPPAHPVFDFRGYASEAEKVYACANALALCQPSLNESFSLTIMESWLAARPVLVHERCAVTREHVRRGRGGLWFDTYEEFAGAVNWLRRHPERASRMGQNGQQYVRSNFTWPAVLDRFSRALSGWQGRHSGSGASDG
jgi:glycosyltransferase involved in cell wall biosynthesis